MQNGEVVFVSLISGTQQYEDIQVGLMHQTKCMFANIHNPPG